MRDICMAIVRCDLVSWVTGEMVLTDMHLGVLGADRVDPLEFCRSRGLGSGVLGLADVFSSGGGCLNDGERTSFGTKFEISVAIYSLFVS